MLWDFRVDDNRFKNDDHSPGYPVIPVTSCRRGPVNTNTSSSLMLPEIEDMIFNQAPYVIPFYYWYLGQLFYNMYDYCKEIFFAPKCSRFCRFISSKVYTFSYWVSQQIKLIYYSLQSKNIIVGHNFLPFQL